MWQGGCGRGRMSRGDYGVGSLGLSFWTSSARPFGQWRELDTFSGAVGRQPKETVRGSNALLLDSTDCRSACRSFSRAECGSAPDSSAASTQSTRGPGVTTARAAASSELSGASFPVTAPASAESSTAAPRTTQPHGQAIRAPASRPPRARTVGRQVGQAPSLRLLLGRHHVRAVCRSGFRPARTQAVVTGRRAPPRGRGAPMRGGIHRASTDIRAARCWRRFAAAGSRAFCTSLQSVHVNGGVTGMVTPPAMGRGETDFGGGRPFDRPDHIRGRTHATRLTSSVRSGALAPGAGTGIGSRRDSGRPICMT